MHDLLVQFCLHVGKFSIVQKCVEDINEDDEYKMEADIPDDESTLLEEEKIEGDVDYETEIAELEVFYSSLIS